MTSGPMMSGPMAAVTIFSMTRSSTQAGTTVLVREADDEADALLTPVEQLATAFFDDTRALVRATELDLPAAFGAPLPYADDPELFLRLLAADVERFWLHQVVASLALVVTAPAAPGAAQPILYRGVYRLRPSADPPQGPSTPRPIRREVGKIEDALGDRQDVQACLVCEWTRDPAVRKSRLVPPRYAFTWAAAGLARFDEPTLAAADRFDTSTRGTRPGDELRVLRLAIPPIVPIA
jgi:hypothetical protein